MEKIEITVNGKILIVDIEKAKELGLVEEKESIKEKFNWVAEKFGEYYSYSSEKVFLDTEEYTLTDKARANVSNYFKTKEAAQQVFERRKSIFSKIERYLANEGKLLQFRFGIGNYHLTLCVGEWIVDLSVWYDRGVFYSDKETLVELAEYLNKNNIMS